MIRDRLLIANIGKNTIKNRQSGFFRRNRNSGLCHQRQKTDRLQDNGFAASIWSADDEYPSTQIHVQRNRRNGFLLASEIVFQQRMPRFYQAQQQTLGK